MVVYVLLCSQITLTACLFWLARRVMRLSALASRVTKRMQAPQMWESRLAEMSAEVASLSSSFEKVARLQSRLNSRAGMRELRERDRTAPPPVGAGKGELRRYYGLTRDGPDFARRQLQIVPNDNED